MDEKPKIGSDSEGLGFWRAGEFVVGHVPEVNGSEACELPEFVPTKHEVIQIAKYWFHRRLDNSFFFFTFTQTGSSEWRTNSYANRRLDRVAALLSEEEFEKLIVDVERDYKDKNGITDEVWNIFTNGSKEELEAYQDKVQQEIAESMKEPPEPNAEQKK